ncbi:MAG: DNA repair protein RecN [Dehalococcoidia bacterium]|nr:DNA repair protein RecN [Dehalococcoidia bacterium]
MPASSSGSRPTTAPSSTSTARASSGSSAAAASASPSASTQPASSASLGQTSSTNTFRRGSIRSPPARSSSFLRTARTRVLVELDIRNLAIAEQLRVSFSPGLNVITGETGSGKSLIIDALSVLLGSRADADMIRTGEETARVEGIFELEAGRTEALELLEQSGIDAPEGQVVISRELRREGRGPVRINGRAMVQSQLVALGQRLVDIHGQGDYMSLLRPAEHLLFLDRYASTTAQRRDFARLVSQIRGIRSDIAGFVEGDRERVRRFEQLTFELGEIEAAGIEAGEEDALRDERGRLTNAEDLTSLSQAVFEALEEGEVSAVDALGRASEALAQLAHIDPRLDQAAERLATVQSEAADLSREMRSYGDEIEFNPQRLEQIEERLARLATLKRKYGATLGEVVDYAAQARAELERLSGGEQTVEDLRTRETDLLKEIAVEGEKLSSARRTAAASLAATVESGLAELGMDGGRFAIRLLRQEDAEAGVTVELPLEECLGAGENAASGSTGTTRFDRDGLEDVEFLVSLNPGEELRPLAKVASGGETSRLMLVLKSILGSADAVPTLVFDEVDAGIGGLAASTVGRRLRDLGRHHQVICISHLPQIAAHSRTHLSVTKEVAAGRTSARVAELGAHQRIVELAQMIGGPSDASVAAAREMLNAAGGGESR